MKTYFIVLASVVFSACEIIVVDPNYDRRQRVLGNYDVTEYSETYNRTYYYGFRIDPSYESDGVVISNFYDVDISVYAYVDYNKLTIPSQVVEGFEVQGVGTIRGDKITLSYHVTDLYKHSYTDFCVATARKGW